MRASTLEGKIEKSTTKLKDSFGDMVRNGVGLIISKTSFASFGVRTKLAWLF